MPKRYPEEFRRKVLDLVAAGRPIAQIASDLGISDQSIYGLRRQELNDTGLSVGMRRPDVLDQLVATTGLAHYLHRHRTRSGAHFAHEHLPEPTRLEAKTRRPHPNMQLTAIPVAKRDRVLTQANSGR
jgi:transposase-like protein